MIYTLACPSKEDHTPFYLSSHRRLLFFTPTRFPRAFLAKRYFSPAVAVSRVTRPTHPHARQISHPPAAAPTHAPPSVAAPPSVVVVVVAPPSSLARRAPRSRCSRMAQSALSNLATARAMSLGFPTAPYLALNASLGSPFSVVIVVVVVVVVVVPSSGMIERNRCRVSVWRERVGTHPNETRTCVVMIGAREGGTYIGVVLCDGIRDVCACVCVIVPARGG